MRLAIRLTGVAAVAAAVLLSGPGWSVQAASLKLAGAAHGVFVQTNNLAGNSIVAFRRNSDGSLARVATYPTGGRGGRASGSASDPLASQGSLVLDAAAGLLFAVNAGSDSVSVFGVSGDRLRLHQVVPSRGAFPVSIAVNGSLVYVLNAGLAGDVSGYRIGNGTLHPIAGSVRSLGLSNSNPPFFLSSPAQVGFTPAGSQLVVTTKNNGMVDVFSVNPAGRLSGQPVKNAVAGVPFAFVFDPAGQLALVNAGDSSLGTFTITAGGTLTAVSAPVTDGQTAACWIAPARGFDYVANTGSGTISQFQIAQAGTVNLINPAVASGIAGPTDLATAGGDFLYNQAGLASSVDAYSVNADGSLTPIQSAHVPHGGSQEGIAAT